MVGKDQVPRNDKRSLKDYFLGQVPSQGGRAGQDEKERKSWPSQGEQSQTLQLKTEISTLVPEQACAMEESEGSGEGKGATITPPPNRQHQNKQQQKQQ